MADEYDVFLSHNGKDKVAVEAIALRLRGEGLRPFLDRWHLVPGEPWMPALERALAGCEAVAVFFGPYGVSDWLEEEKQLALGLVHRGQRSGRRVIPVLLPGACEEDVEGFLSLRTWVDLEEDDGFVRLVAGITGQTPETVMAGGVGSGLPVQRRRPRQPAWLEAPYRPLRAGGASVPGFSLLRAEHGVVRMSGREALLEDFAAWCEGPGLGIRLVTAPGGHGKTRLLRELCERRTAEGWTAGISRRSESPHPELVTMAKAGRPMLLAIDYAETWGDDLEALLSALAPYRESGAPIRVVLAARAEAEWWKELPHGVEELRDLLERLDAVVQLGPIEDASGAWADAVKGFSGWRPAAKPVTTPAADVLTGLMKEGVLTLHVAALLAVEGGGPRLDAGVGLLFDELLRREVKKYWRPEAKRLVSGVDHLDEVLRTVACIGTLVGPLSSVEQARGVLSRTPGLGRQTEATLDGLARVFVEVWAVGASGVEGVIVHYDGAAWSSFMTSTTHSLRAVAGSGPADVWAVGSRFGPADGNDESILHFGADGAWTPVSSAAPGKELLAVWSADGGSAWAMGGVDALVHWDGGSWSALADPSPDGARAMWSSDPTHITAVGTNANILEGDGASWSLRVRGGATLRAAGGLDEEHRWAVGERGTIFTFEAEVTDAPDCVDIGGTCGDEAACPSSQGHLSDYACDGGAASVCCVSANACGGVDAVCCTPEGGEVRAICHNGAYMCPAGSDECPGPPP